MIVLNFLTGFAKRRWRLIRVESWEPGYHMIDVGDGYSSGHK